uniref:Uncharacterized protein n=1 Tax=Anguilla anguilla TaxID=7936 RepID=A0A0E9XV89_ANGAN
MMSSTSSLSFATISGALPSSIKVKAI